MSTLKSELVTVLLDPPSRQSPCHLFSRLATKITDFLTLPREPVPLVSLLAQAQSQFNARTSTRFQLGPPIYLTRISPLYRHTMTLSSVKTYSSTFSNTFLNWLHNYSLDEQSEQSFIVMLV